MKLTMLGTGHAAVTKCYNTCFVLEDNDEYFLGPIVTFMNKNKKLEVIDGQQRLTTILLLLRAFYSKYGSMQDEQSRSTRENIEKCIWKTDEFGKTFLDYVVEYNAVNGIRFLHDKYKLKIRFQNNQFDTEPKGMFWVHDKGIELARMISNMNDVELFNDIYDSRYMMASNGFYLPDTIFAMDDFAEIVLDNNDLLESVFETKSYRYLYGRCAQRKLQKEYMDFNSINPVINTCLNYALKNLKKYKKQAIEILKFGINHNERINAGLTVDKDYLALNECGGLVDQHNNYQIVEVVVVCKMEEVGDAEIDNLIKKLPTYRKL